MEASKEKPDQFDVQVEYDQPLQPKAGKNGIILVPRPSDDPRDPLVREAWSHTYTSWRTNI